MRQELLTRWGRDLDAERVLAEYPRPQLVRDSYLNLNGWWDYAITPAAAAPPGRYDGRILVPFSPEAPLSGVGRQLQPDERLTYHRDLVLPGRVRARGRPGAAALRGRRPDLHGPAQRRRGGPQRGRLPAVHVRRDRRAAARRERPRGRRTRPFRRAAARVRQAAAAPRRHLVHRAVRHLADGLGRGRPGGVRRPADPRAAPRRGLRRGDRARRGGHRDGPSRRHEHHRRGEHARPASRSTTRGPGPRRTRTSTTWRSPSARTGSRPTWGCAPSGWPRTSGASRG